MSHLIGFLSRSSLIFIAALVAWAASLQSVCGQTNVARTGRFIRGTGSDPTFQSFVVALDFEKGVPMDNLGGNGTNLFPGQPLYDPLYHYNATNPASATSTNGRIAFQSPIVAFGSRMGGSPCYVGTQYRLGAYAGFNRYGTNDCTIIISVFNKTNGFNWVADIPFCIPLPSQTNVWSQFVSNGYTMTLASNGLRTSISASPGLRWGTAYSDSYLLVHEADGSATNYLYDVWCLGSASTGGPGFGMVMNAVGTNYWSELYTIEFESRPSGRVLFIDQPHFAGSPLPPEYLGKSVQELTNLMASVTNQVWLTNSASYINLDESPELRRHPVLDKFVTDMRSDPLALAAFVQNEIELTDPMAYGESNRVTLDSLNLGGVNRSALGTFLERQGSPWEQCALLVYLLRAAGHPAAYVFPTNSNVKVLDSTLSKILQMQVKGALAENGVPYTTNSLITVNYPWVVANINSNRVVHIFPWLKDTEVVEGLNLYDYMPTNYESGFKWVRQYLYGDTNILGLSTETDVPRVLFPKFIEQSLLQNYSGLSLDDLGVRVVNRRNSYTRWEDLPCPNYFTNQSQVAVISNLVTVTNAVSWLRQPFDLVKVQVVRNSTNLFDTGDMRMCDLHNRTFLLYTNSGKLNLWLAPYRPSITNQSSFGSSDTNLLNIQLLQANVLSSDTNLSVRLTYRRHLSLSNSVSPFDAWESLVLSNNYPYKKDDVSGICLDVGRVTFPMLSVHIQELWQVERQKQTNSSFIPAVTDYQGAAAYLMGMAYYANVDRFRVINEHLHKVRVLSRAGAGLGKLSARLVDSANKVQPGVDMLLPWAAVAANVTLHPDSGFDWPTAVNDWAWMDLANNSAEEHAIINGAFSETNAISTVGLLELAQRRSATNRIGIIELDKTSYSSRGNKTNAGYSSVTKLKEYDPAVWASVSNAFQAPDADFTKVYITPASITNGTGSYKGMGALIFSPSFLAAYISGNQNGGAGSFQTPFDVSSGVNDLPWSVVLHAVNSVIFQGDDPLARFINSLTPGDITVHVAANDTLATPDQVDTSGRIADILNVDNPTYVNTTLAAANDGFLGDPDFLNLSGGFAADPVNMLRGEFYIDTVDLSLPGAIPLKVRRNYLSQNPAVNQFGAGWKWSFTPYLVLTTNSVSSPTNVLIYAADPEGSVVAYRKQSTNLFIPAHHDNPTLNNNSIAGMGATANMFNSRIDRVITNGVENYVLTSPDGSIRRYQTNAFPYIGSTNTLLRSRPYLIDWRDNRGNSYRFTYGTDSTAIDFGQVVRIESSSGSFLEFIYDEAGRIVETYSGDGRRLTYEYDAFGDLVKVTLPDLSEMQYEYQHYTYATNVSGWRTNTDSYHLLTKEIKPDGRVLFNEYDKQRRVTNQWSTVGPDLTLVRSGTFIYSNNFKLTNAGTNLISGYTTNIDVFGRTTVYGYDKGLLTLIKDPLGQAITQDWYLPGNTNAGAYQRSLKSRTDKRGLTTSYLYDSAGNVTNTTVTGDLTGDGVTNQQAVSSFTYSNNLLTLAIDPAGNRVQTVYSSNYPFLPAQIISFAGTTPIRTNFFEYYNVTNTFTSGTNTFSNLSFGLKRREIRAYNSPDTATQEWLHDGRGFPTQQVHYTGTSDPNVTNSLVFNARGELVERIDALGRKTRFDFDGLGRPRYHEVYEAGQTAPLAWEYSYYNENGELVWSDGPRYNPEDYAWRDYDGAGRKSIEIRWRTRGKQDGTGVEAETGDNLYATTRYDYDNAGNLTRVTDPRGVIVTNAYDTLDRLIQSRVIDTTGSALATNYFGYEPGGKMAFETNALGGWGEKRYTSTGQLKFQKNPDGSTNQWRYAIDGRLTTNFLSNGSYWRTIYDDANRRVSRIFYSAGGSTLATLTNEFDFRGNLIRQVDAAANAFTNSYDGLDRLKWSAGPVISFEPPPGAPILTGMTTNRIQEKTTYVYDGAGRVLTSSNALAEKTVTTSDALGRTLSVAVYSSTGTLLRTNATLYTANHHGATNIAGSGSSAITTASFTDNDGHPVLNLRYPISGTVEYTLQAFDIVGNRTQLWECSSTNNQSTIWATNLWVYDGLNRVKTETVRDGATTTFSYDAAGNLITHAMPGGLTWNAVYTNDGRILVEYDSGSGNYTRTNSYTYFPPGSPFVGLLQTRVDGRGVTSTLSYDDWLRPTTNASSGSLPEQNLTTVNSYDVRGFVTKISEYFASSSTGPTNTIIRGYDAYGNLMGDTNKLNGMTISMASQSWDSAGRRVQIGFGDFGYAYIWRGDGLMASAVSARFNYGGTYTYDTAGQLLTRTVGSRTTSISPRDGVGRPLAITNTIGGWWKQTESLSWRGDGLLTAHTIIQMNLLPDTSFANQQSFAYAAGSRRLTNEIVSLDSDHTWTNSFAYDGAGAAGPGVLTRAGAASTNSAQWNGTVDSLKRISTETNTVSRAVAYGHVNGLATMTANLDGKAMPVTSFITTNGGPWQATLELSPGAHQLQARALHYLGQYTAIANNWFTNSAGNDTVTDSYDGNGNVTQRLWKNGSGQTNRTLALTYDARGRLHGATNRLMTWSNTVAVATNGADWIAIYDALGRLVRTVETPITNSMAVSAFTQTIDHYFDPLVQFLELAVNENGLLTWKLIGPDSDGRYGSQCGTGGFEGIAPPPNLFCPVVSDARGNAQAIFDQTHANLMWFTTRLTGYGAVPGYRPVPLGQPGPDLAAKCAWRNRWNTTFGLTYMGARFYDPEGGRFLSADPLGHRSDASLYSFAGGNPIKYWDPLGLCNNPAFALAAGLNDLDARINSMGQTLAVGLVQAQYNSLAEFANPEGPTFDLRQARMNDLAADYQSLFDSMVRLGRFQARQDWIASGGMSSGFDTEGSASYRWRETLYDSYMAGLNVASFGTANSLAIAGGGSDLWGQGSYSGAERVGQGVLAAATLVPGLGFAGRAEGLAIGAGERGAMAGAAEEGQILYRGVARDSVHDIQQATGGAIVPRGGSASMEAHVNDAITTSPFTSWTTDINVARRFAGSEGPIFQVNRSQLQNQVIDTRPFSLHPGENEFLIRGNVYGVRRVGRN